MTSVFLEAQLMWLPKFCGNDWRLLFSPGFLIDLLPILLHGIDKIMEGIPPFREERMRQFMRKSPQVPVRGIGGDKNSFRAVQAYFAFERACHLVIALTLFSALSLYVSEVECTGHFSPLRFDTVPFVTCVALLGAVAVFITHLYCERFEPEQATPRATRPWERFAYAAFVFVLVLDILMSLTCHRTLCRERPSIISVI